MTAGWNPGPAKPEGVLQSADGGGIDRGPDPRLYLLITLRPASMTARAGGTSSTSALGGRHGRVWEEKKEFSLCCCLHRLV